MSKLCSVLFTLDTFGGTRHGDESHFLLQAPSQTHDHHTSSEEKNRENTLFTSRVDP